MKLIPYISKLRREGFTEGPSVPPQKRQLLKSTANELTGLHDDIPLLRQWISKNRHNDDQL